MNRYEALQKVSGLVQQLKVINCAYYPKEFKNEVLEFEQKLSLLEDEMALMIDTFMANKYMNHNKKKTVDLFLSTRKPGQLSGIWSKGNDVKLVS